MASEYGWSLADILERTYVDDLFMLIKAREKRKLDERRILLALISNPHVKDPNALWRQLTPRDEVPERPTTLDKASFDVFKSKLTQGSHIVVK